MMVYLVRHGEALSREENASQPLSESGRAQVLRLAALLAGRIRILPGYIYHSPKVRAHQTASILSEALSGSPAPSEHDGLLPLDDPFIWDDRLEGMDGDVLLVGHLPHLSRLASLLLLRDPGWDLVDFSPGAVLCLERTGNWRVKWMMSPGVLKEESRV